MVFYLGWCFDNLGHFGHFDDKDDDKGTTMGVSDNMGVSNKKHDS